MLNLKSKLLVSAFCMTLALCSCRTIKPDAPTLADANIPAIQQPLSKINVPIRADLRSYFQLAENSVPNEVSDKKEPCQGLRYSYFFRRSPFNISGVGNTVNLKFVGSYGIDLTYCATCILGNCVVPKIGASCGVNGEAPRKMEISYKTSFLGFQPNYHLSSKTILSPSPNALDRCKVSILKIDATDRLIGYIQKPLNNLAEQVDEKIARVDLRPHAQRLWDKISKEIKLGDLGYLSINPQSLGVSSFNFTDESVLNVTFGIIAGPAIMTETNPKAPTPVPDLNAIQPGDSFDISIDLYASYDSLSRKLDKQIVGQHLKIGRKIVKFTGTKISGIGNQKVVIAIDFKGSKKGTIYLVGTPNYNAITHQLTFPDLTFDLKTKSLLLKAAEWIFNDKLTSTLKDKAKFDFTKILEDNRLKLEKELNGNTSGNIKIEGKVSDLNFQDIYPTEKNLLLRTLSKGSLQVTLLP